MGVGASCKPSQDTCCGGEAQAASIVEVPGAHPKDCPGCYEPQPERHAGCRSDERADVCCRLQLPSPGEDQEGRRIVSLSKVSAFKREHSPDLSVSPCFSRRSTESSHFQLDRELLRGIPLKATLYGFGRLWTHSPMDLPDDTARAALWAKSARAEELDIFLSHTWLTPGWQKVLALLVQSGSHCFLLGWFLGAAVFIILEWMGVLPPWWSYERGLSSRIGGFLGSIVGLLISPYLPWVCGGREKCFLDVVSINQADPELMKKGIYGLGGFLAASAELRILWSPPYLSRLWCVFELAAFRQANPEGRIQLTPLFLETGLMYVILAMYFFLLVDEAKVRVWGDRAYGIDWFPMVLAVCSLLPFLLLLHGLRRVCHEKRQLIAGMRDFDLEKVDCKVPSDREFIYQGIRMWYRSSEEFVRYVRGALADELTEPFFFLTLPPAYWLMAITPVVAAETDVWLHRCWQDDTALTDAISLFLISVVAAPLFCMNIMQLVLFLCEHASAPVGVAEYAKTCLMWLVMVLCVFFFVLLAGPYILESRIPGAIIASMTNLVIFYVAWRCKKRMPN